MDPTTASTPIWLDKGFYAMFLAPLFAILNSKFGLNLNATELLGLIMPVIVYIVSHKWKTSQIITAQIAAQASSAGAIAQNAASISAAAAAAALNNVAPAK